jgi:hypothetical protein
LWELYVGGILAEELHSPKAERQKQTAAYIEVTLVLVLFRVNLPLLKIIK